AETLTTGQSARARRNLGVGPIRFVAGHGFGARSENEIDPVGRAHRGPSVDLPRSSRRRTAPATFDPRTGTHGKPPAPNPGRRCADRRARAVGPGPQSASSSSSKEESRPSPGALPGPLTFAAFSKRCFTVWLVS